MIVTRCVQLAYTLATMCFTSAPPPGPIPTPPPLVQGWTQPPTASGAWQPYQTPALPGVPDDDSE